MPGLKLDFLKNPAQRMATGKSLPLKQVEAIVLYGRPEQRAKVVQKLLPSTYGLSLNKTTHHVLITLLDHCDNLSRTQMLYHVRRKLRDLYVSSVGNSVLQHLIEKVPLRQRKEIAETFVLNVEKDEFKLMCEHPYGNHVAQKLMEYSECVEVLAPNFIPYLRQLSVHEYGMRVVAKYIDSTVDGWRKVMEVFFPVALKVDSEDEISDSASAAIDVAVRRFLVSQSESMVVTSLLRHLLVPACLKDAFCAHLCEYSEEYLDPRSAAINRPNSKRDEDEEGEEEFALPDFGSASSPAATSAIPKKRAGSAALACTHVFAFVALFEHGDEAQRKMLWDAIQSNPNVVAAIVGERAAAPVAVAAVRFYSACRQALYTALFVSADGKTPLSVIEVAADPIRTLLFRCFIEVDFEVVTAAHRQALIKDAVALSKSPVASPVLQKLVEADSTSACANGIYAKVKGDIGELARHTSASFLVQSLLQFGDAAVREALVADLLAAFDDLHDVLSYAQGSRVVQKMLAYAPDDAIVKIVDQLISKAEAEEGDRKDEEENDTGDDAEEGSENEQDEAEGEAEKVISRKEQRQINRARHYGIASNAIFSYALHAHACYVMQALLRETRSRQLDRERKLIMNELKPHVFDLAVSPWAGRVVLDTMMLSGSDKLTEAMKNVVFLRAESWLSDVSEDRKKRGNGVDPTMRAILKRQRDDIKSGKEGAPQGNEDGAITKPAKKKKRHFRSIKK